MNNANMNADNQPVPRYITEAEARLLIPSKRELWEGLQRNGKCVPPYQSKCITIDYLEKVRANTYYVPSYTDMSIRPCPNPPKKKRIFEEIMRVCN